MVLGMDPAGPLYLIADVDDRVDPSDAEIVVGMHTNGGNVLAGEIAYYDPVGHVNFYPAGGHHQP